MGGCSIDVLNVDGMGRRTLVTPPSSPAGNCADAPSWSPDGTAIVFEQGETTSIPTSGSSTRRQWTSPPHDHSPQATRRLRRHHDQGRRTARIDDGLRRAVAISSSDSLFSAGGGFSLQPARPSPPPGPCTRSFGAAVDVRHELVFRVGRSIRLLDTAKGKVRTLARAASTPIGLWISGARVAWAENVHAWVGRDCRPAAACDPLTAYPELREATRRSYPAVPLRGSPRSIALRTSSIHVG